VYYLSVFTFVIAEHCCCYHFCLCGGEACVRGKRTFKSQGMSGIQQQVASCEGTGHGEPVWTARNGCFLGKCSEKCVAISNAIAGKWLLQNTFKYDTQFYGYNLWYSEYEPTVLCFVACGVLSFAWVTAYVGATSFLLERGVGYHLAMRNRTVRHLRCVFINYNWINQLSNTTIWWLDIYVVNYIGINCMFRLLWPSSGW